MVRLARPLVPWSLFALALAACSPSTSPTAHAAASPALAASTSPLEAPPPSPEAPSAVAASSEPPTPSPSVAPPETDACAPPDDTPHTLTLEHDPEHPERVADASFASFPAESEDGRELVFLVTSQHDFIGGDVQTLRFFDAAGRRRSTHVLYDARLDADASELRKVRLAEAEAFEAGSKLLARKKWRTLERARPPYECRDPAWSALDDHRDELAARPVRFTHAGIDLELVMPDVGANGDVVVRRLDKGVVQKHTVRASFSPVGTWLGPPKGACGLVVGLDAGFLTHDGKLAALLPTAMLGGDMCKGELEVDRLFFVHLPAR